MTDNAITIMKAADLTQPQLLNDFIQWIDRGEKTTATYITNLRQFAAWLRMERISEPTRQDIVHYRQWLESEHDSIKLDPDAADGWSYRTDKNGNRVTVRCKPNTVHTYLQSVKAFFRWLASNNLYPNITDNLHTPKVKHDEHARDALAPDEIRQIEEMLRQAQADHAAAGQFDQVEQDKRNLAMFLLAATAGLRVVELHRADVSDLTRRGGQCGLYIWGKGHAAADTFKPLAREVYDTIQDYLSYRQYDGPALFVATGHRSGGNRIAAATIGKMLKKIMKDAGFDSARLTAHSLRHSAGTAAMAVTGNNIYQAQTYMRHADPMTTEIYTHTDTLAAQSDMAQQIYGLYHGTAQERDTAAQLQEAMTRMNPKQLKQLNDIARAMLS